MHSRRSDVKDCPNCNSPDVWIIEEGDNPITKRPRMWEVSCGTCGFKRGPFMTQDAAVTNWNREKRK